MVNRVSALFLLLLQIVAFSFPISAENAIRVSEPLNGTRSDANAVRPNVSANNDIVLFEGVASRFVEDAPTSTQIILFDRSTGELSVASKPSTSEDPDDSASNPNVSDDGRYVVFGSRATNLVDGDTNDRMDCFLLDRSTGEISRVSVASYSVGETPTQGNERSCQSAIPAVSNNGTIVAFAARASNLVSGDTNGVNDVFVHSTLSNSTSRVSVSSDGDQSDAEVTSLDMSGDGRYIVFTSAATTLVPQTISNINVFLHDRQTATTLLVSKGVDLFSANGTCLSPRISNDGSFIVYHSLATNLVEDDTNNAYDIFLYDRVNATTTRVSAKADGSQTSTHSSNSYVSNDGTFVTYVTLDEEVLEGDDNEKADMVVLNRMSNRTFPGALTNRGTFPNSNTTQVFISDDGRYSTFDSNASDIVTTQPVPTDTVSPLFQAENDLCLDDDSKSEPGTCGCGVSDEDLNGNGNADCIDPTASDVPAKATGAASRKTVSVSMQEYPGANVSYDVIMTGRNKKKKKITRKSTSSTSTASLKGKKGVRRWNIRYKVSAGSVTTKRSKRLRLKVAK